MPTRTLWCSRPEAAPSESTSLARQPFGTITMLRSRSVRSGLGMPLPTTRSPQVTPPWCTWHASSGPYPAKGEPTGAHRHHGTAAGLLAELVEVQRDLLEELGGRIVAALDQQNVVVAQGVRHDDEVFAVDLLDERFVAADIVDVIEVPELLQQRQGIRAAP